MAKADPDLVNFSTLLVSWEGQPIEIIEPPEKQGDAVKRTKMTLGFACLMALNTRFPEDRDISPEDTMKRGDLATSVWSSIKSKKPVPLTAEERVLLKARIAKVDGLNLAARHAAIPLIDPAMKNKAA